MKRRRFLGLAAGTATLAGGTGLNFLSQLRPLSAAEATLPSRRVALQAGIEPLVRLLEDTPRERVIEEVAHRVKTGLPYRDLLAALFLAGVRNIQPRPVGFKFHAVLVIHSAHLASLASAEAERWLPLFWAIDQFKSSQAADVREGDWTMGPVDEKAVPPSHRAKAAFLEAMDGWDEAAADAAIVGLARTAGAHEIFELFCRYGVRDFREIGHKAIYIANSFRTLETMGWHHAEPVLRSLAYALLDRNGAKENPAKADYSADRPFRQNLERVGKIRSGWLDGELNSAATLDLIETVRQGSAADMSTKVVEQLNKGVSPRSLFDAYFDSAGELLMQSPGILSLHASTFSNAVHYLWQHATHDETRRLLLLQNAAFLPLFRGNAKDKGLRIDKIEPLAPEVEGPAALDDILADISSDKLRASRKIVGWLEKNPDPAPLAAAARRLIFTKGRDSHDYKFSSAVFEDSLHLSPPWRDRFLAASVFNLRGAGDNDNALVARVRAALG
jgi:hypothetical protein